MKKTTLIVIALLTLSLFGIASLSFAELPLPHKKMTSLGLYLTSSGAYKKWKAAPDEVKILDCRTPEEYVFLGHAPMAHNVPKEFLSYEWNADKKKFMMKDNPNFISEIQKRFKTTDTILVMCRSGSRSAKSVNMLAKAGFKNVYNIIDGFEGDKVKNPDSIFDGKREVNGWKNVGLPWTYALDPKLAYLPLDSKLTP